MRIPAPLQFLIFGLIALILFSIGTAVAASNTVPATRADLKTRSIGINDYKPSSCSGLSLTTLVTGSGTITGTDGNDLILGSSGIDTIDGLGGNDCIVSGGGDDTITGGDGSDICLGGPGIDVFITCEGEYQ
jgi:RTX calcium-binding nonapeptide repeat (4 copies)